MGYGINTNLVLGIMLSSEEAAKLHDFITQNQLATSGLDLYDWLEESEIVMVASNTDSRIHNTQYEPGFEHCFGVLVADKGYGASMSSEEFRQAAAANDTPARERFSQLCAPILDAAKIQSGVGRHAVTHMA
jgi:hypothetical protein